MRKFLVLAVGTVSGVAFGACGAFVQADRVIVAGVTVPYGVALAVSCVVAWQLWLAREYGMRLAAAGVALGWIVATLVLGLATSSEDVVLAANTRATAYLVIGAISVTVCAFAPPLRRLTDPTVDASH